LSLLVRTWNLFHGRTKPPSGRVHLERMVRLVSADGPHLVALQEVPVWALGQLEAWSGMTSIGAVARPARLGRLGRRLTALAPDVFRSAFNGQANAVLLRQPLRRAGEPRVVELKPRGVTERRICQLVRLDADGRALVVANFHATAHLPKQARAEVARVADLVRGDELALVCGDFNVPETGLPDFSAPIRGIDQILVRGLALERPPTRWRDERRRLDGHLLSDHTPVEAVIA
jgi:endonuclease/exonuclease/phosphatase family metal-dependent hydrolase